MKIRLTINNQSSPTHKIAHKKKILKNLERSGKSYIKNTEKFAKKIKNIKLEQEETIISFDISGMYPSLPKEEVVTEVIRKISDKK